MADEKEDWGREEEIKLDHQKIEGMVPKNFHKWLKVFGKIESERILVRKVWDHAIDLKDVRICQQSTSRSYLMLE